LPGPELRALRLLHVVMPADVAPVTPHVPPDVAAVPANMMMHADMNAHLARGSRQRGWRRKGRGGRQRGRRRERRLGGGGVRHGCGDGEHEEQGRKKGA